jgi:hypothetical protein
MMDKSDKPKITAKEVSWQEAVAAHRARKDYEATKGTEDGLVMTMLAVARVEKQRIGPLVLEPYSLAHSLLLEELRNPLETGGEEPTNLDIAAALLVFGEREMLEQWVASYGAEATRKLVYEGPLVRQILGVLTNEYAPQIRAWFASQFGAVAAATGETAAEAEAEAAVRAAEAEAGNG